MFYFCINTEKSLTAIALLPTNNLDKNRAIVRYNAKNHQISLKIRYF
jgi:hypothetical protein